MAFRGTSARLEGQPDEALAVLFDVTTEGDLSVPMRSLLNALLLYKSMFAGPWFASLSMAADPATRDAYESIRRETAQQARQAAGVIARWDAAPGRSDPRVVTTQILKRLLADLLEIKKSSTEVFLAAGISSPNDELRRSFLELADVDRKHAEELRKAMGSRIPDGDPASDPLPSGRFRGVRTGPFDVGTISRAIRDSLDAAAAEGHVPSRIIVSQMCLRHLRDEGSVEPQQGNVFGVPVEVDFAWSDEAFAITSGERRSLAEVVTEMTMERRAARGP